MSIIERALDKTDKTVEAPNKDSNTEETAVEQSLTQAETNKKNLSNDNELEEGAEKLINEQVGIISNALDTASESDSQFVNKREQSIRVEIDLEHLANQGIIVPHAERTALNEEFRRIKQPLINNIKGKSAQTIDKANLIQVTSAIPGEGKSFTAINLAIAISLEFDHRVLLVDGDVLRPSLNSMFGIEERKGLSEYLSSEVNFLSEVLLATNIPKLTLLPAGKTHHLSSELFSSELMDNLFRELSERYSDRVIIIDSPPILNTNEANILSRKVGQTVFVIEQNRTTQAEVKKALSQFDDNSIIGIVMNKSRSLESSSEYGYYYY